VCRRALVSGLEQQEEVMAEERVKKFEVVRTVNIGGKNGVREVGGEVSSKEVKPEDLKLLIESGYIRDADAPIPPSQAEGIAAFDRLLNVAVKIGAAKRDGSTYKLGDKTAKGLTEFRATVTLDELEAAIVKVATD
jgi:hypothetical protein